MLALEPLLPFGGPGPHRDALAMLELDRGDVVLEEYHVPHPPDPVGAGLPHLAGTQSRILEFVDERLDAVGALGERGGGENRLGERQALDALRRPLGPDFGAGDAPDLFGVGLEEGQVKHLAETVGDPLLEVFLDRVRPPVPAQVAQHDPGGAPQPQAAQRIGRLERIVEKLAVIVNARQSRHRDEVFPKNLVPEILDRFDLGEEAVSADIEPVALVLRRTRDPADDIVALEHGDRVALLGQQVGRGETGGPGTDDRDAVTRLELTHRARGRGLSGHAGSE